MQGVYYLLSIVAVLVVFIWYIRNDGRPDDQPTTGLLAMRTVDPDEKTEKPVPRSHRKWQRKEP